MKLLMSGFEPFDGLKENPSQQMIDYLNSLDVKSLGFSVSQFKGIVLPVSFSKSFSILKSEIDAFHPDFVICMGLAYNRSEITLERVAINIIDAEIPDNEGIQPKNKIILENESDGLFSPLPLNNMLMASRNVGVQASISNTAGTYTCNALLFEVLSYGKLKKCSAGFIHLPPTPEIKPQGPFLDFQKQTQSILAMISAIV
ncbi:MAG TPA: hypothetical protein PLJ21_06230 [Pseudobdellovibrionaceae bacterium]|nr:hypothetical protein [Pseudobdellovibrionaceae bacterium]